MGIFERGTFSQAAGSLVLEFAPMDKPRAFEIARAIDPSAPKDTGCGACAKTVVNILRAHVGMPPLHKEIAAKYWKQREAICRGGCPVYVRATDSCGRLVLDAISSRPVTLSDGSVVHPCGCPLITATRWKDKDCPAGFWPSLKK